MKSLRNHRQAFLLIKYVLQLVFNGLVTPEGLPDIKCV